MADTSTRATQSPDANATVQWFLRAWKAVTSAAAWAAAFAGRAWGWSKSRHKDVGYFLLLVVLSLALTPLVRSAFQWWQQSSIEGASAPVQPTAPAPSTTSDQLHSLESRVSALESTVADLVVATPAPASPSARRPATASPAAAVTANATPAPPTGRTDLDRRLAEFQRRIDATPSPTTTTLKETAK